MPTYQKVPDGKRFHPSYGRICRLHPDKVMKRALKDMGNKKKKEN
jgi:hypothetical protein